MKRIFAFLLVFCLAFTFVACNTPETPENPDNNENENKNDNENEQPNDTFDPAAKSEGVMTYAEYDAAALETEVVIEAYVQATQGWWEKDGQGLITAYLQDPDGAYFVYEMQCSQDNAAKLTKGTKIKVTGYKGAWEGEIEIMDATFEIMEGTWVAEATDVTALLGTDDLIKNQNKFVSFKGMTVEPSKDAEGNDVAFLYKWNGSGSEGDDLYFNVSINGQTYNFTVESYLCGPDSEVYKAVKALQIGDKIDMEGFLYWYAGVNPHITSVTKSN
jgi:hypothetical protein